MAKSNRFQSAASNQSTPPVSTKPAPATDGKKYNTITVNVGKTRVATKAALVALAARLQCRVSDLIWSAIESTLQNPPASAPNGATVRAGSAAGFWVVNVMGPKGLTRVEIKEVTNRATVSGSVFFRFTAGDVKGRVRALRQAQKAAAYNLSLVGMASSTIIEPEMVETE